MKKKALTMLIIIALFLLSSCTKNNSADNLSHADVIPTKLTVGMYSPDSFNPLDTQTVYNEQAFFLMFDSLYNINESFEAVKNLADELTIENGGTTAVITIKPNVKFHDGSTLTANDVAASINYILKNGGYYAYNVRNIESVSVINSYTLKLNLKYRTPNIASQLTFPIIKENSTEALNGTGPFKLLNEKSGKQLDLIKFEDYHSSDKTLVTKAEVNLIPDKLTARSLSGSGILDIFFAAFSDEGLKTVTKSQSIKRDYITDSYVFLKLNFDNPLIALKPFRKALNVGINRQKIADDAYMSHAEPTALPVPTQSAIYNRSCANEQKQDEAISHLKEAGYEDADSDGICEYIHYSGDDTEGSLPKSPMLTLLIIDEPLYTATAQCIEYDLKKIGIPLEIDACTREEYNAKYIEKKYDMCLCETQTGFDLDETAFLGNGGTFSESVEYDFENALTKLSSTAVFELWKPTYEKLFGDFYENPAHIPLVYLKNTLITNDKFKDITDIYINNLYYKIIFRKEK